VNLLLKWHIIRPLPVCQESGNRFILTILDLCTHYPEAIPLKQHTAADVAQALITVFSRFCFPQEILSDQGRELIFKPNRVTKRILPSGTPIS